MRRLQHRMKAGLPWISRTEAGPWHSALAAGSLQRRQQAELRVGTFREVLKRPLAHRLEELVGLEAANHFGGIFRKAFQNRVELLLAGIVGRLILEFGDQHDIPTTLIGGLLGNPVISEHAAVMLGLLADAHPVIVEIAHGGTEHSPFDFDVFKDPNRLFLMFVILLKARLLCSRALRRAPAYDQS